MNDETPKPPENESAPSLNDKLELHHEWLKLSPEDQEKQKDRRLKLQKYDLRNWNISSQNLRGVDLSGSDLSGVDFGDADLSNANLRGAKLVKANLENANTDGTQFGGANVSNAKMPSERYFEDRIDNMNDSSRMIRTLFITLLGALAFCGLTILSAEGAQLLTFSTSTGFPLPIIGTRVSFKWFYYLAPWFLLALFVYFHHYLMKHCWLLAQLPRMLTDNTPLGAKVLPWALNSWATHYFEDSKGDKESIQQSHSLLDSLLGWFATPNFESSKGTKKSIRWSHEFIGLLLAWFATPICLLFFWVASLGSQIDWLIEAHFLAALIGWLLAWDYLGMARRTLATEGRNSEGGFLQKHGLDALGFTVIIGLAGWIFYQYKTDSFLIKYLRAPDIDYQEVSIKPKNWNPENPTKGVEGAVLSGKDLSHANAHNVFLVNAQLVGTNFDGADLHEAHLRNSNLQEAELQGAELQGADLQDANLREANLKRAKLQGADLREAKLQEAKLLGADLQKADLQKAKLHDANLQETSLQEANLQKAEC